MSWTRWKENKTASPFPTAEDPPPHLRRTVFFRRSALACLLALLIIALSGCQALPTTPQATTPTAEPEVTTSPQLTETLPPNITPLIFWEPFSLDRSQGLLLGEMVRDFEAENPDIVVEIVPKSGYVGIHGAMIAALPDGELPDLAVAFPSMIAQYAQAGVVVPLELYLNDAEVGLTDEDLAVIPPGYLEAGRIPGFGRQVLAFPFAQNAIGMWVNETLLAQAGWDHAPTTWDEFEQACFDVVAQTGVGCYPYIESVSTFTAWLYSRGGQQLDAAGGQAVFNSPAGVESLALLRRLIDGGLAWRPQQPYGDYVAFTNGQAAFTFSSTGNSQLYAEAYEAATGKGMAPFQWRQTLIPQTDPNNPATALYGGSFFILQSSQKRQRAAWRLIRWFTDRKQTARWAAELESLPVRISALEVMTDTLEAYPFVQAQLTEILPYARPEPTVAAELEVRDILYTAILSVTQGIADPQTALDQAARKANALLAKQP
ncbi:MAG: ABC transporter substrate-binding protein [Anaerolineae bacterium]